MDLLLATRNSNKTREFREILGDGFLIVDLSEHSGISEIAETGMSFKENAELKALAVSKELPDLVIADDSGLEVAALGRTPGIFSARYAGESANDASNIDKLLTALQNVTDRSAQFRCVIALARAGKILGTFGGGVEGAIVDLPRGNSGFGYDPVFQPTGFKQTFGELSRETKNQISHRAKAIGALREFLQTRLPFTD